MTPQCLPTSVNPVRIFCWTVNSTESSEHCAVWPHRQCPRSQSGQVLGLVRTQRTLTPIRNYGRFECAPERSRIPARAAHWRAMRAVRRAYQAPLPSATTRTFRFNFRGPLYGVRPPLTATMPRYTQTALLISNSPSQAKPQYFANGVKRSSLATKARCWLSACLCAAPKITKLSSGTQISR